MTDTPNGMLFVASDIDPADEADFNAWYDHEHVEERARIAGFISGARYRSLAGGKRYLGLYRTRSLEVFTSPAYKAAFARQTPWSVANLDRMLAPSRRVALVWRKSSSLGIFLERFADVIRSLPPELLQPRLGEPAHAPSAGALLQHQ